MSSLLELSEVRARVLPLSVAAYEALAEMGEVKNNAELIRGVIIKKVPKSPLHSTLHKRIFLFLVVFEGSGLVAFQGCPLRLADSMPEPDAMIVRGNVDDFDTHHPTTAALVVEIAVSSAALDRENASLYAEAGVEEYWIVLASENQIEAYTRPESGRYLDRRTYSIGETLACAAVPELRVPLAEWFA